MVPEMDETATGETDTNTTPGTRQNDPAGKQEVIQEAKDNGASPETIKQLVDALDAMPERIIHGIREAFPQPKVVKTPATPKPVEAKTDAASPVVESVEPGKKATWQERWFD